MLDYQNEKIIDTITFSFWHLTDTDMLLVQCILSFEVWSLLFLNVAGGRVLEMITSLILAILLQLGGKELVPLLFDHGQLLPGLIKLLFFS